MRKLVATAIVVLGAGAGLAPPPAGAQETDADARVTLELNAVETVEAGCRISFLVQNGHAEEIASLVYEAVLFDASGRVERLTLFDFGALPPARPRVRQFVVTGLACDGLARLLINGAETCAGEGLPEDACIAGLRLDSRTDVELLG